MMKKLDWYQNPTKKTLVIFGVLWFISNVLLILTLTDLFTANLLQGKNIIMIILMIGSTLSVLGFYIRYYKRCND